MTTTATGWLEWAGMVAGSACFSIHHPLTTLLHALRADLLVEERNRLHAGDLEALAAAHVLASHEVVAPHHVRARLGELGAVALIGAGRELAQFGAHQPTKLVLCRLLTVWTG